MIPRLVGRYAKRHQANHDALTDAVNAITGASPAGANLPAGWTQNEYGTVETHDGSFIVGDTDGASVETQRDRVIVTDSGFTQRVVADGRGKTADPLTVRPREGGSGLRVDSSDGPESAAYCDGLPIVALGEPQDCDHAARLDSLPAMAAYNGTPELPADPTPQDIAAALVTLGLATQATE